MISKFKSGKLPSLFTRYSSVLLKDFDFWSGNSSFIFCRQFPLVSKCGYIRKLVSHADLSIIEIPEVPGGVEAFQLAAKFAYGINFEISVDNVAMLRCVADSLEMTEEYAVGNLVNRTEAYLNEVALSSLSGALAVLHSSENLLPVAEKLNLVSRCIGAIAYIVCTDNQFCSSGTTENSSSTQDSFSSSTSHSHPKAVVDWWAEELTVLRIDMFQRVLMAMKARGFKQSALGPVLMLYAQKSLRGLVSTSYLGILINLQPLWCLITCIVVTGSWLVHRAGCIWEGEEEDWAKRRAREEGGAGNCR